MSVPEGGVGDLDRDPLPQVGGEARRTEIEPLPRALGRGNAEIDSGRPFLPWIELGRCRAVGLVDRHLRQPAQQLGAAVSRGVSGQQFGSLIDEGRRDVAAMKSSSSRTACRKGMLVLTPRIRNSASARRARVTADSKVRPRAMSLTSMESKYALISTPMSMSRRRGGCRLRPPIDRR